MPEAERSDAGGQPATPEQTPAEVREDIRDVDTEINEEAEAPEGEEVEAAPPEPVDDGTEEVEHNGKKYKIARELRPQLMAQQDYTRNIQQVAEEKKALAAERERLLSVDKTRIEKQGQLAHAQDMVARYAQLNWPQLEADDFQLSLTRQREHNQWKDHRDNLSKEISNIDAQNVEARRKQELESQQETVRRVQEAAATYHREIPNWSNISGKVVEYGVANGFSPAEMGLDYGQPDKAILTDTRIGKILAKAMVADEMIAKQRAAAQKAKAPPAQATDTAPLVTVTSRSGGPAAKPTLEKASMAQFIALRDQQEEAKAKSRH